MNHHHPEKEPAKRQQHNLEKRRRKNDLLFNLKNQVHCRLGASKISGVGVFAIKDIPKNSTLFKCSNEDHLSSLPPIEASSVDIDLVGEIEDSEMSYVHDMIVPTPYGTIPLPVGGMNSINIAFYLNHSTEPNVSFSEDLESADGFLCFVSVKDIKEGEELTQDYNNLSQDKESLYDQFPFLELEK